MQPGNAALFHSSAPGSRRILFSLISLDVVKNYNKKQQEVCIALYVIRFLNKHPVPVTHRRLCQTQRNLKLWACLKPHNTQQKTEITKI